MRFMMVFMKIDDKSKYCSQCNIMKWEERQEKGSPPSQEKWRFKFAFNWSARKAKKKTHKNLKIITSKRWWSNVRRKVHLSKSIKKDLIVHGFTFLFFFQIEFAFKSFFFQFILYFECVSYLVLVLLFH